MARRLTNRWAIRAFVLPLLAFTPILLKLKKQGLSRYGALVSRHRLVFEAKWINGDGESG